MNQSTILRKIQRTLVPGIVQFGPPRTGSTLVWNALRFVFPSDDIPKRHDLNPLIRSRWNPCKIICTIRNPLDAIASSMIRYEMEPTMDLLKEQIIEFEKNGMWDAIGIHARPRTLILKYEDFVGDFDQIFDAFERFFKTRVERTVRESFQAEFDIHAVKQKSDELGNFASFDLNDHIHGRHVSENLGAPGRYATFFSEPQIRLIRDSLRPFFKTYGYE